MFKYMLETRINLFLLTLWALNTDSGGLILQCYDITASVSMSLVVISTFYFGVHCNESIRVS